MTEGFSTPSAEPTGPSNPFQRIAGVFFSPVATFREIAQRPDWVVPLILIVIVALAATAVVMPRLDIEASVREQLESQEGMSEEQIEKAVEIGSKVAKISGPIGAVFGSAVMLLITAGILLLAVRMFGGVGGFKQAFAVTNYAWLPNIIKSIIVMILVGMRDSVTQTELATILKSNLGFLVDPKTNAVAFAFLGSIDLFTIWYLVLLVIGFSFLSRLSRGKTAAIVIVLFLITVIAKVGMASLGAMGGGS